MASISAVLTDDGLTALLSSIDTSDTYVFLKRFEVSETAGTLVSTRDLVSMNTTWYSALISGRDTSFPNYITAICTIPPESTVVNKTAAEIYLIGEKSGGGPEFLFAVGQIESGSGTIYDFEGALTLRIKIPIIADSLNTIQFTYTQATEITDHNSDPGAHPDLIATLAKAGNSVQLANHSYMGQHFDEKALFDVSVTLDGAVYKNNDGKYHYAISDGTNKAKVSGYALLSKGIVVASGFITDPTVLASNGLTLYLSASVAGIINSTVSPTKIGLSHGSGLFQFSAYNSF